MLLPSFSQAVMNYLVLQAFCNYVQDNQHSAINQKKNSNSKTLRFENRAAQNLHGSFHKISAEIHQTYSLSLLNYAKI